MYHKTTIMMFLAMFIAAFVSGCATSEKNKEWYNTRLAEKYGINAQPQSYKDGWFAGYENGQATVNTSARLKGVKTPKDVQKYATDTMYNQGWNDGYSVGQAHGDPLENLSNALSRMNSNWPRRYSW